MAPITIASMTLVLMLTSCTSHTTHTSTSEANKINSSLLIDEAYFDDSCRIETKEVLSKKLIAESETGTISPLVEANPYTNE